MRIGRQEENTAYLMHRIERLERRVRWCKAAVALYVVGAFALASANIIVTGTNNGLSTNDAIALAVWNAFIIGMILLAGYVLKFTILDDNKKELERLIEQVRWMPTPLLGVVRPPEDEEVEEFFKNWEKANKNDRR